MLARIPDRPCCWARRLCRLNRWPITDMQARSFGASNGVLVFTDAPGADQSYDCLLRGSKPSPSGEAKGCPYRECHSLGERRQSGDPVARCGTLANCCGRCSSGYSDREHHLKPRSGPLGTDYRRAAHRAKEALLQRPRPVDFATGAGAAYSHCDRGPASRPDPLKFETEPARGGWACLGPAYASRRAHQGFSACTHRCRARTNGSRNGAPRSSS